MIEVYVESIRVNMTNYKRVVMLKEKAGQRYLPIWIGHFEADAIAIPMQNVPVSRPLTHDLLVGAIGQLGARWTQATISRLEDETFYATLVVDQDGRHVELDCRPSDAISAAIRSKVPIFVEDAVMEQAALTFGPDAPTTPARPAPGTSPVERTLASVLERAEESAADEPAGGEGEVEEPPYLPGGEPAGGRPPEPFGALPSVTGPLLAALQSTLDDARRARRTTIGPGDLMVGLLRQKRGAAHRILADLSVEVDELQTLVEQELARDEPAVGLTPRAEAVLGSALEEASRLEERTVGGEHLLLALAGEPEGSVPIALGKLGLSRDAIRRQVAVLLARRAQEEPGAGPA
jgi:bifunctional DNase/RNase